MGEKNTLELRIGTRVRRWFVLLHNFIMLSSFLLQFPCKGVKMWYRKKREKYGTYGTYGTNNPDSFE